MEKLPMCRLCLVKNVRMYIVANRNLHELYEKLTDVPFVTKDRRPMLACFFCYAKLKQCYRLMIKCLEAEDLFAQKMKEGYEPNSFINEDRLEIYGGFIKSATKNISIVDVVQTDNIAIKEEFPAVYEGLNIIEPKEERQSDELEPDNLDNGCVDVADMLPHHPVSDTEDRVPLMAFQTEVEEAQEFSKKKRRASETTNATVAKKPKLDTRRTILEDAVPSELTKKDKSDSKVIRTTQKPSVPVNLQHTTYSRNGKGNGNAPPTNLQLTPSSGVRDPLMVNDSFDVVDAELENIGFTPTSSTGPARSAVGSSPIASSSSVTNEPSVFDDVEDDIAAWERSIVEMPGSDVEEEDLPDMEAGIDFCPRQRFAEEFPAEVKDLAPVLQGQLAALDARDDSALRNFVSNEDMLTFQWTRDASAFSGKREVFTGLSGPTFETDGMTPLDIFERIWDESIINLIVAETNRYANHLFENPNLLQHSKIRKWKSISAADLWVFYGIMMLQSFVPNPVERDYWHPEFPDLRLGNFKDFMSYNKFTLIKKCLHFVDNSTIPASKSKFDKISPVIDHLNRKFSSLYIPEQNIAIDESLLLWKGRLSFVQLIANKAAREGIKSYELCESRTGYLWKFEMYAAGKRHQSQVAEGHDVERVSNEPEGATSQIVYRLVRPLLNKGHTLVMDNFYNSPLLSRTLKAQKTDTIGTLRLNREFVPDSLRGRTKTNMRPGEVAFSHTEDLSLVVWKDSNLVSLISTYHKVEVSVAEKNGVYKYKPKVVLDYNLSMGGVDKKDQFLQAFPVGRVRNMVWYKKLFRRLLNVSIHNAYVIYSHKKKILYRQFRMMLADQILRRYCPPRLTPAQMPASGHFPVKATNIARCRQCPMNYKTSRTTWACDTCGARLCITCFKDYHIP